MNAIRIKSLIFFQAWSFLNLNISSCLYFVIVVFHIHFEMLFNIVSKLEIKLNNFYSE